MLQIQAPLWRALDAAPILRSLPLSALQSPAFQNLDEALTIQHLGVHKGSGVGWPVSHGSSQASVPSSLGLSVSLSLSLSLSPHLPPLISLQRLKFPLNRCTFTCKFSSQQILDPHQAEIVELVPARHIHDAVAGIGRQHLCSSAGRFWALRFYNARFQLGSRITGTRFYNLIALGLWCARF